MLADERIRCLTCAGRRRLSNGLSCGYCRGTGWVVPVRGDGYERTPAPMVDEWADEPTEPDVTGKEIS